MMEAVAQQVAEPIFEDAGQAVHVAFLVMSQPARQDAPFRKALIRSLESINLNAAQRHWLDQLRGVPTSTRINFGGLDAADVRAQCVMITQAVATKLPDPERWVLLAKYGQTDFEDVVDDDPGSSQAAAGLDRARKQVEALTAKLQQARKDLDAAREYYLAQTKRITGPAIQESAQQQYHAARDAVRDVGAELLHAESKARTAQIAVDRMGECTLIENGRRSSDGNAPRRRFAFSAERIEAIDGLAQWFAPMFPRLKPLALNCMLGRMFATHKKIDITARDMAKSFGGSHMTYLRASWKMKNHLRQLEENAIARLAPHLAEQGVVRLPQEIC